MNNHFVAGIMIVSTILFVGFLSASSPAQAYAGSAGTTGTGAEPSLPDCPTAFTDTACLMSGAGSDALAVAAVGLAEQDCNTHAADCETSQATELSNAKTKCEAVSGCVFHSTEDDSEACTGYASECLPPPGTETPTTIFRCAASGVVDYGGYTCARPVVTPTPVARTPSGTGFPTVLR